MDPSKNSASKEDDNPGRWSRKQAELFFAREASKLLYENPALLQIQISQLLHSNPDYAEAVSKYSTKKSNFWTKLKKILFFSSIFLVF